MAKGYLIANITVTDPAAFAVYRERVVAVLERFGGRYLIRAGTVERKEGGEALDRVVVIEFETLAAARTFYESEAYAPLLAMRAAATRSSVALVEGVG